MEQTTLSKENFRTLLKVVQFAIADLEDTQGAAPQGRLNPSEPGSPTYEDCLNLQAAIETCTKEVSP